MSIKEYERARQLIEQIDRLQQEIESRLEALAGVKQELTRTLEAAEWRLTAIGTDQEEINVPDHRSRNQHAFGTNASKRPPARPHSPAALGDYVREAIIEAARPLKVAEIIARLKARKYTNTSPDPFRTLPVRLYRLQKRGVENLGGGYFFLTEEWRARTNLRLPDGFGVRDKKRTGNETLRRCNGPERS